jgi:hypothetical protein
MALTRLEKLVALLANGPTEASRLAAARQLGDLQRAHPAQLHTLLQHVLRHLFASDWATRRAAAAALEAVAQAVDTWEPRHSTAVDAEAEHAARSEAQGAWLRFASSGTAWAGAPDSPPRFARGAGPASAPSGGWRGARAP